MYAVSILSAAYPLVSELILFREDAPLSAVSRVKMGHGHAKYFCVASLPLMEQMSLICRKSLLVTPSRTRTFSEDRISRAQLAILNPSTPAVEFLERDDADLGSNELTFSPNIVCLEITGPDYSEISFIDLPGTSQSQAYCTFVS